MQLNEFLYFSDYVKKLKEEESTFKGKEFSSLVPIILQRFTNIKIRDFIDVDGTFAIITYNTTSFSLYDAINLYQSIRDVVGDCTYMTPKREGLIQDFSGYQGFWIQFE
jgi:hypothetical protein